MSGYEPNGTRGWQRFSGKKSDWPIYRFQLNAALFSLGPEHSSCLALPIPEFEEKYNDDEDFDSVSIRGDCVRHLMKTLPVKPYIYYHDLSCGSY